MKISLPLILFCCLALAGCKHEVMTRTVSYEVSSVPVSQLRIQHSVPGKADVQNVFPSGWTTTYNVGKDYNHLAKLSAIYNGQNVDVSLKIYVDGKLVKERTADLNNTNNAVQTIEYTVK